MTRFVSVLAAGGLWLALALIPGAAAATAPDALVRDTAEEVLGVLRADSAASVDKLAEIVDTKVIGHFDFTSMTRLAVGKYWRQAEKTEQAELVAEFRTLLVRTYSHALLQFVDYDIDYRPLQMKPDAKTVVVQTLVSKGSSKPIHMDYRMFARDGTWKVYDVLVDGVSLVINYRSLFGATVEKSGINGLIRLLRDKNTAGTTTG